MNLAYTYPWILSLDMRLHLLGIASLIVALLLSLLFIWQSSTSNNINGTPSRGTNDKIVNDCKDASEAASFEISSEIFTAPKIPFSPISARIVFCQDLKDESEVVLTTPESIDRLLEVYNSLSYQDTTRPMDFPRLIVYFYGRDGEVAHWRLDFAGLTSGSEFGLGNKLVIGEASTYNAIYELYNS